MDKRKATIDDLFVNFRESMQKHEKKEALAKQRRLQRRTGGQGSATSSAEKTPLFESLLGCHTSAGAPKDKYDSKDAAAMRCFRLLTENIARDLPSSAAAATANEVSLTESSSQSVSALDVPHDSKLRQGKNEDGEASMPEYAPPCEQQRRDDEAAALKVLQEKLAKIKDGKEPRFKPLVWREPSFNFPVSDSSTTSSMKCSSDASSSSAASSLKAPPVSSTSRVGNKKRKASDELEAKDCGIDETMSTSTSKVASLTGITSPADNYPFISERFVDKWLRPDTKKLKGKDENE